MARKKKNKSSGGVALKGKKGFQKKNKSPASSTPSVGKASSAKTPSVVSSVNDRGFGGGFPSDNSSVSSSGNNSGSSLTAANLAKHNRMNDSSSKSSSSKSSSKSSSRSAKSRTPAGYKRAKLTDKSFKVRRLRAIARGKKVLGSWGDFVKSNYLKVKKQMYKHDQDICHEDVMQKLGSLYHSGNGTDPKRYRSKESKIREKIGNDRV